MTTTPAPATKKPHRHRWTEDAHAPTTGCGAEWFYECSCGATKYVCEDQGERTVEITEAGEDTD
jgi:hypothetical protein